MTGKRRSQIVWAALIAVLLGGAYVIVARNGPVNGTMTASPYFH
jgi:hypothetical protein